MLKKMFNKICVLIILLVFPITGSFGLVKNLDSSQQLTISDGLAHNGVTCILEDSRGYLWFGTYEGLNRYDGYEIKVFKNTLDKDILASNRVRSIAEDSKGNLWIGTDEGITLYNYSQEKFKNIYTNKLYNRGVRGPVVRCILINEQKGLVVCATEGDGVLVFDHNYSFLQQYLPTFNDSKSDVQFYDGISLDKSNYLFATSKGPVCLNLEKNKMIPVLETELALNNSITKIDENTVLLTLDLGIAFVEYHISNGDFVFELKGTYFKSEGFKTASIDKFRNLWLGTLNDGVIHIENVDRLKNNKSYKQSYFNAGKSILRCSCFAPSTKSGCWFGTFNDGIFNFDLDANPFGKFNIEMDYKFGLSSNLVTHFSQFDDHRVLVTATLGGIALFNVIEKKFEPLPFYLSEKDRHKVASVFVDSKKNIWMKMSNEDGLYRVRKGTKTVKKIINKSIPAGMGLRSFSEDNDGNIWIGATDNVYKICLTKDGTVKNVLRLNDHPFFKENKLSLIRCVYVDPVYNFIWLGADSDGLFRIESMGDGGLEDLKIQQYVNDKSNRLSISSNFVSSIIRLPNNEFWIGTEGGGICKVINSDKEPEFIAFSEKNGLSNNAVKNILYDDEYNLWITTNIGLNKFDTKDYRFRKFSEVDGLPFEDFWFASIKLSNGFMMQSGLDGFCYYNPADLPDKEELPILEFGDFKLDNNLVSPGDTIAGRVLLSKRLNEQKEIELNYDENVFSIELKSLHFSTPDNHFLRYQLLPINDEWVEVNSDQRNIYYSGLQAGEYELNVMASNSLKQWTEPRRLKIIINPPFWETTLAYIFYFSLLVLILYLVMFYVLRFQTLQHNLQIEKLEKDNVKEVNLAKLRFFSNISHEIKTPITLITGPVDLLLNRFQNNVDVKEKLELVKRQSKKISKLIDQVHDFQKSDANQLKVHYSTFGFQSFLNDLLSDFEFMANNSNKNLKVKSNCTNLFVNADNDKLEKILNNLLNNAFKFTESGDTIQVEYTCVDRNLIIKVSDTGRGIISDDLPFIFERFYQSTHKHGAYTGGSGIGLAFTKRLVEMHYGSIEAESELNEGTTFTVRLPIVEENVSDDIKIKEDEILSIERKHDQTVSVLNQTNLSEIKVGSDFSNSYVFLVEDNDDMRNFVSSSLSKFFKLKSFVNGRECLKAMEEEWPDIVISDVLMPELNGLELCRHIKSDIKTSHIPVILLTACATIEDQIQGIKEGADSYIRKPFDLQHLVARTEFLLQNRKQLRQRFQIDLPLSLEKNKDNGNDAIFLEKLYELMAENLDNQDLDLDGFAKDLFLNRTHFYQKVKAITNQTPFELLKSYRLKKASEFLVQDKLSVNEVYLMTGFKSRTHFSKLFKEKYNVTPGKFAVESSKKYSS
ncbi:ATP-binding protein [Ancylomarina sp. 16SWW S1-10-2]|uniref:hybrid sensor histidine kinase/response regulator transcription factor n=1 Tax=Ancylomarina sp. 16SWW S1-10-2 TaxID=2499681 RepID=UPI0012AE75BB|nr:ATP-binding protein [Ancylomarina sp. 16SWW S1-10-2]MRT91967.1 hybrid sensor histidine kinase/response regulator [Ancylomarina sp. 16SWW S1-10-2]